LSVVRAVVEGERDGPVPPDGEECVVDVREWPCPTCEDQQVFAQPPCVDGHTDEGGACPEWACSGCGTAVFTGDAVPAPAAVPARRAA
jgi:hypothetical protein